MPKLTPQQRWDQVVTRQARGAHTRRKLAANRHRNWLTALAAHASAKAQAAAHLSDLEEHLVQTIRQASRKSDLVAGFAYIDSATPPEMKAEIFPGGVDRLTVTDALTFADLGRMAPDLVKGTLSAPNTNNLDIAAIHSGQVRLREQMKASPGVLRAHASSLLRAVSVDPVIPKVANGPIANRY